MDVRDSVHGNDLAGGGESWASISFLPQQFHTTHHSSPKHSGWHMQHSTRLEHCLLYKERGSMSTRDPRRHTSSCVRAGAAMPIQ